MTTTTPSTPPPGTASPAAAPPLRPGPDGGSLQVSGHDVRLQAGGFGAEVLPGAVEGQRGQGPGRPPPPGGEGPVVVGEGGVVPAALGVPEDEQPVRGAGRRGHGVIVASGGGVACAP